MPLGTCTRDTVSYKDSSRKYFPNHDPPSTWGGTIYVAEWHRPTRNFSPLALTFDPALPIALPTKIGGSHQRPTQEGRLIPSLVTQADLSLLASLIRIAEATTQISALPAVARARHRQPFRDQIPSRFRCPPWAPPKRRRAIEDKPKRSLCIA